MLLWLWPLKTASPSWSAQPLFTIETGLMLAACCSAAWLLTSRWIRGLPWLKKIFMRLKETPLPDWAENAPIWHLLLISLAAGIGEEFLFRGFLQGHTGVLIASIVFGLCHFLTFGYFVYATLFGLGLGWFYEYSGHALLPVVLAHAAYDAIALLRLRYQLRRDGAAT